MQRVYLALVLFAVTSGCYAYSRGGVVGSPVWLPAAEVDYVVIRRGVRGESCAPSVLGVATGFPHVHEAFDEIHKKAAVHAGPAEYALVNVVRDASRRRFFLIFNFGCEIVYADVAVARSELPKVPPPVPEKGSAQPR